ncbi:MAG: hypothetical protein ACKO8Z_09930, partial [Prosthecobacter sp.]
EAWNMYGNANGMIEAIPSEKHVFRVFGGTYLDAEWPTDLLGQLVCGLVDEKRQQQLRDKATEFLVARLQGPSS